ncbi:ubiquitin binding protein [Cylindrobasidium torrendii FP15055 ss-10]|uniref:Vacuolar protein sorting-associated protein 27 n=1 Tax=Cylindrobasidium torrendii FP15055 ss-10 TaxID=1314674 RepID=A0A0D7B5D2_9AGAR|nr:ubiquitin binding protein [Cylindrobasidium torrendii FP15055 ss-10]
MSLSSWLWGSSTIDDAVEKATSELLPTGSEDIALNLEISDQIRSKSVPAKDAMRAIKRRLNHKNPNVQLLALGLADTCVKNGGDLLLVEIASREFLDNLVSLLKIPGLNLDVKNKMLRLIQNWSIAFEGKPALSYAPAIYKQLMVEGYNFPPKDLTASTSAMVDTSTAPEWIDSEVCMRCRDQFTFTNRKHHCRNCGLVFDHKCSSKSIPLPHFGITQDVRVCDACFSKLSKRAEKLCVHRHSVSMHGGRNRAARDFADADLQRAIQLSLQETGLDARPGYVPSEPPILDRRTRPAFSEEDDPDLRAAIEASLRESEQRPSAPIAVDTPRTERNEYAGPTFSQSYPPGTVSSQPVLPRMPNHDLEPLESDVILTFSQTVEQVKSTGMPISRYPAVGELYDKANGLRPKLTMSLDDAGKKEQLLTEMHDKLSQAVKLYDHLLTEQVSQPRRQAPPTQYSQWQPSYQPQPYAPSAPPEMAYQPSATPTLSRSNTYAQPSYAAASPGPQLMYAPPQVSSPPPPMQYAPPTPTQQHYSPVYAQTPISAPAPPAHPPVPQQASVQPQYAPQAPQQPVYAPAPPQQPQYAYAPGQYTPAQALPQFPSAPTMQPQFEREETRKEALLIDL